MDEREKNGEEIKRGYSQLRLLIILAEERRELEHSEIVKRDVRISDSDATDLERGGYIIP